MFRYDKDMERVMQAKKFEILKELEDCKLRILKELSGVDKATLTKLRSVIADYNNIDYLITTKINNIEMKVNSNVLTVTEGLERIEEIRTELLEELLKIENLEGFEELNERVSSLETTQQNINSGFEQFNTKINQSRIDIDTLNLSTKTLSDRLNTEVVKLKTFILELEVGNGVTRVFNETTQTHTFSATWSSTGFKVGNNIELSQIITLCGVYPSQLKNGGGGWTNHFFDFYNTGTSMGFKLETKNHGNNGDFPEKVYLRFLISETPIN